MKQYIILIITFLIIVSMYFVQMNYLKETASYMKADIYEIEFYIKQDNYEKASISAKTLESSFESYREAWDSYADHEHVEDIAEYICLINEYIRLGEKTDVLANTACLSNKIEHVINTEKISLANIF